MKKKRSRTKLPNRLPPPLFERIVGAFLLRPRVALAGLFVLGFGLALALLSYDPADPPDPACLPPMPCRQICLAFLAPGWHRL